MPRGRRSTSSRPSSTELTLPEIAHRVGLGTTHNFSRFFSEQAGESATDYRSRTVAERKEAFKGK